MKLNLQLRLMIFISLVITVTSAVLVLVFVNHERLTFLKELREKMRILSSNAALNAEYYLLVGDSTGMKRLLKTSVQEPDVAYVEISDKDHRIVARATETPLASESGNLRTLYLPIHTMLRSTPIEALGLDESPDGYSKKILLGNLRFIYSLERTITRINRAKKKAMLIALGGIIVSCLAAWLVIRLIIVKPLGKLLQGISLVSAQNLDYTITLKASSEIESIAHAFNRMTKQLSDTLVSREYVNTIINSMHEGLFVIDAYGWIKRWNPAIVAIFGCRNEDVSDHALVIENTEGDEILSIATDTQGPLPETTVPREMRVVTKNKETRQILFSLSPMHFPREEQHTFVCVIQDITERRRAMDRVLASEKRFRELADLLPQAVFEVDETKTILFANEIGVALYGVTNDADKTLNFLSLFHQDFHEQIRKVMQAMSIEERISGIEVEIASPAGRAFSALIHLACYANDQGNRVYRVILTDISMQKKVERDLIQALEEREVLLKEIHHRVKNNMQVISSLLSLQSESLSDSKALSMFRESQDRVEAMMRIHEKLYQSRNFSSIDFEDYINSLTRSLFETYRVHAAKAELKLDVRGILLDITKAIPCALIINELLTNSLKYAFNEEHNKGYIRVSLTPEHDRLCLTVADNGVGLPEEFNVFEAKSLGLKLVVILTRQLKGTLEVGRESGTTFVIRFPR